MPAKIENISDFTAEQLENYVKDIFKIVAYFKQKSFNEIFHLYFDIFTSNKDEIIKKYIFLN